MPGTVLLLPEPPPDGAAELAAILAEELAAQGMPAPVRHGAAPEPQIGRVVVSIGTRGRLSAEGPGGLGDDAALRRTIVLDEGICGAGGEDPLLEHARRAGALFVLDEQAAAAYRRHGVRAQVLALGYMPSRATADLAASRPVDIVGVGAPAARRACWREAAESVLSRHRTSAWPAGAPAPLSGAKVAINLHAAADDHRLSWQDVLPALHAGAVVVSEHATGLEPLVPGRHLLVADPSALAWVAEGLLADRDRLARMRADALRRIETQRPLALSVSALRIAIVQLAGRP